MVDALHTVKTSQTYLARLTTSQADNCIISVTVDTASRSGEHKFTVIGIMVAATSQKWGYNGQVREGGVGGRVQGWSVG